MVNKNWNFCFPAQLTLRNFTLIRFEHYDRTKRREMQWIRNHFMVLMFFFCLYIWINACTYLLSTFSQLALIRFHLNQISQFPKNSRKYRILQVSEKSVTWLVLLHSKIKSYQYIDKRMFYGRIKISIRIYYWLWFTCNGVSYIRA